MSFETWWKDYCKGHDGFPSPGTIFEAGRAESEAKIAVLKAERDALRGALREAMKVILEAKATGVIHIDQGAINRSQAMLSTPASGEPARKLCPDCKHSLEDNNHGFDQNDGFLDEKDELVHSGHCTYCRICNPRIFQAARKP